MSVFQALFIALIEGLTEYLPISSTAHMIFTSTLFGIQEDEFVKMYQVSIQLGAILSVVVLYWRKFFDLNNLGFYIKLGFAVLPALILGYIFDDMIEDILGSPIPIAVVLVLGGIIFLFVDKIFNDCRIDSEKEMSMKQALIIGFWQCLAMMPGTSRSAASIIGGMQQKLTRKTAAEFSFFLAVPTMLAVCVYSIFVKTWDYEGVKQKGYQMITSTPENIQNFALGNIIAFLVALVAMKFFVAIIGKYGFKLWGWYRIVVGIVLLIYFAWLQ